MKQHIWSSNHSNIDEAAAAAEAGAIWICYIIKNYNYSTVCSSTYLLTANELYLLFMNYLVNDPTTVYKYVGKRSRNDFEEEEEGGAAAAAAAAVAAVAAT